MKFPLVFNKRVRPICLPKSDAEFPDKMKCFVSGWGRTTLEGGCCCLLINHYLVGVDMNLNTSKTRKPFR